MWKFEFFNGIKNFRFFEEFFGYQLRETIFMGLFCQGIKMVVEKRGYYELEIYSCFQMCRSVAITKCKGKP